MFDPMENVLTQITDPNLALETVTNRNIYLSNLKLVTKTVAKEAVATHKTKKPDFTAVYNDYSDKTRECCPIGKKV
ncbi:hypothetical protein CU098_005796 [Rhizopus stolonifer]|uniref:Uncharacterized protein n=1 Tax=Rhizopus stolonifer TaxID=4846 RepID=A0A367KL26_RHIST|nr:hypothetical protein CU098_005796 [Rhizopus stolonifer]